MSEVLDYDPQVIVTHARQLYAEARSIVLRYGLMGLVVGWIAGYVVSQAADSAEAVWFVALVGTGLGVVVGRSKAFALKLRAQEVLCQLMIERNTRQLLQLASTRAGLGA